MEISTDNVPCQLHNKHCYLGIAFLWQKIAPDHAKHVSWRKENVPGSVQPEWSPGLLHRTVDTPIRPFFGSLGNPVHLHGAFSALPAKQLFLSFNHLTVSPRSPKSCKKDPIFYTCWTARKRHAQGLNILRRISLLHPNALINISRDASCPSEVCLGRNKSRRRGKSSENIVVCWTKVGRN